MYCILYLFSGLIRIRRNSSLGPQELCQSKSCLGPSTQSQLELRGERRHRSLPPASAAKARRSREEGRWKKRAWKGPHWIWLLSSVVQSTRLRSLQSKRGWGCTEAAETAEPFSTVTEFGKLRGVGSNEDPNRCLEKREARSFDGGGGGDGSDGGGGADNGGGGGKSTLKVSKAFSGALQWTNAARGGAAHSASVAPRRSCGGVS